MTGTFIAPSRRAPRAALGRRRAGGRRLRAAIRCCGAPYLLQTLTNAWLAGLLALSLTLVAGTAGQMSFGHAGAARDRRLRLGAAGDRSRLVAGRLPIPLAGLDHRRCSARCWSFRPSGCAAITSRSRRSAIGEIVSLVILNWESLTHGAMGVTGIPPLSAFGHEATSARAVYWICLAALVALALLQARLLGSHIGRTLARDARRRSRGALAMASALTRYKALAFALRRLRRRRQRRASRRISIPISITRLSTRSSRCWR